MSKILQSDISLHINVLLHFWNLFGDIIKITFAKIIFAIIVFTFQACDLNKNHGILGQFHQHFMTGFFVRKCFEQLFFTYSLALYSFGEIILAQKLLIKRWRNWPLTDMWGCLLLRKNFVWIVSTLWTGLRSVLKQWLKNRQWSICKKYNSKVKCDKNVWQISQIKQ